jgi:uroporphyrinogen decarboxylase
LSTETDLAWANQTLQPHLAIQGNLNPLLFTEATPTQVQTQLAQALALCANQPGYIVNLGHGFTPATNIDTVQQAVNMVKNYIKPE